MEKSNFKTLKGSQIIKSTFAVILLSIVIHNQTQAQVNDAAAKKAKQVTAIIEKHLILWNEQDQAKRKKLLKEIYAPDIEMIDRNFVAKGPDQVDKFIAELQKKSPDFRFSHAKPIDTHHNIARLYWQVGNAANPAVVNGMDFFVLENGKVKKLYVFVESEKK